MEARVILRWLWPKLVCYRNVSSKADGHYSPHLAHWGFLYYMYTLQHMVRLSDGGVKGGGVSVARIEKRR